MKRVPSFLFKVPEYYLILIIFLAGYTPPMTIQPMYILIIGVLILQILCKHRVLGRLIGGLFFICNLLFLGALLSEFSEFSSFDTDAKSLLFVGLSIWLVNLLLAVTMIYKYTSKRPFGTPVFR